MMDTTTNDDTTPPPPSNNDGDGNIVDDNVVDDPATTTTGTTSRRLERRNSYVRRSFSEEFAPPPPEHRHQGRHGRNDGTGSTSGGRNAYWGYDNGNRQPTSSWTQPQPPNNQHQPNYSGGAAGMPWGYNPSTNTNTSSPRSSHHHYYHPPYYAGPPPLLPVPSDGSYEQHQRPAFNWPSESANMNIFDDPLPARPDSRAGFASSSRSNHHGAPGDGDGRNGRERDAETPTRSNRGAPPHRHHSHQHHAQQLQHYHHYHPYGGEIQRQYSWEEWEHGHQPPFPRGRGGDSMAHHHHHPQGLQRLHHHHRENDLFDLFSRPSSGGSVHHATSSRRSRSRSPPDVPPTQNNTDGDIHSSRMGHRFLADDEDVLPPLLTAARSADSPPTSRYASSSSVTPPSDGLIRIIRRYDVLCGRGIHQAREHHGNLAFRDLVRSKQVEYLASIRNEKAKIAMDVMAQTRRQGGRFLKKVKVRKYEAAGGDGWEEMKDKQVYDKVCQSLREGAPRIRQHMLAMSSSSSPTSKGDSNNNNTGENKEGDSNNSPSKNADKENSLNQRVVML